MKKSDEYYIKAAIKKSKKAYKKGEVPVGCVIVIDDDIITPPTIFAKRGKTRSPTRKSLLSKACRKLGRSILDDATIYITLEPCLMCVALLCRRE